MSCIIELQASPQVPDYLVVNGDTIAIYSLPLYDQSEEKVQKFYNVARRYEDSAEFPIPTNLWRGYSLLWELLDNKLYLISVVGNKSSDDILQQCFSDNYSNGKVYADWYSGILIKPKGEILRWDGVFSRTYMKEDLLKFRNGELQTITETNNYIHLPNGITRINNENPYEGYPRTITDTLFRELRKLDWKQLSEVNDCECDAKYIIEINEKGKIDKIEYLSWVEDSEAQKQKDDIMAHQICIDTFLKQLRNMQFDVIKWNGEPFKEQILIDLFYSTDDGLELFI